MSLFPNAAEPAADDGKKPKRKPRPKPKTSAAVDRDTGDTSPSAAEAATQIGSDNSSAAPGRDTIQSYAASAAEAAAPNRYIDTSAEYRDEEQQEDPRHHEGELDAGAEDNSRHDEVLVKDSADEPRHDNVAVEDSAEASRDKADNRDTDEWPDASAEDDPRLDADSSEDSAEDDPRHASIASAAMPATVANHTSAEDPRHVGDGIEDDAATGRGSHRAGGISTAEGRDIAHDHDAEVVELRGQRLRRISPRQMRLEQRRKHPPVLDVPEPPVNTAHGDEPAEEELDENRREGISIGEIVPEDGEQFPDTAGRGPPRTLTDICAAYPIGNGLHYIRVERTRPEMYLQTPCAGVLGEITRPMTEAEFRVFFGGNRYELVVYGPDPRGKCDPTTGQPIIKALTKPIHIRVPGNPSPETLTGFDPTSKRSPMFPSSFERGQRLPTSADASIHRDSLSMATNLIREERAEKAALRAELNQGSTGQLKPVIDAMKETAHHGTETLREELRHARELHAKELDRRDAELVQMRREIERMRDKPTEAQGAWQALSSVAQSLAPGRSSGEELQRIHDSHNNELRRLEDQHRRELADARASFDDRLKVLQDQLDKERTRVRDEVRDVTDRLERREKDAREVYEQRMKDQRESLEARQRDAEERHRGELDRMRAEHERELRSLAQQHELVRTTEKQSQEGRMAQLKDRIDILKEEVERWKNEAAKNGDWAEQMAEFEKKAEAAGYQKVDANAPQTWQDRIADAFGQALRNADKIAASVGTAIRDRKDANIAQAQMMQHQQAQQARQPFPGQQQALPPGPQQQAAPPQQRVIRGPGGRPVQTTRTIWSSEDMPMPPPAGAQGTPVVHPDSIQPPAVTVTQAVQEPPPPPVAPQAPPHSPPPQAAPEPQGQPLAIDAEALEQFRLWAESEINAKSDPNDFGRAFVERVGVHQAHQVITHLKIEKLFEALSSTPQTLNSPILRRDGQQFMRRAWAEAGRLCRQALGLPEPEAD